jgi:hypothetical protein
VPGLQDGAAFLMDDVQRLDFQRSPLETADQLEKLPREKRTQTFNEMVDKAFEFAGAEGARCLHFNACLVTELRRRGVPV